MSDWTPLGPVQDISGAEVEVSRHVSGALALGNDEWTIVLGPEAQATLAGYLDRAAMPGQPATEIVLYGCCEHCEDAPGEQPCGTHHRDQCAYPECPDGREPVTATVAGQRGEARE